MEMDSALIMGLRDALRKQQPPGDFLLPELHYLSVPLSDSHINSSLYLIQTANQGQTRIYLVAYFFYKTVYV